MQTFFSDSTNIPTFSLSVGGFELLANQLLERVVRDNDMVNLCCQSVNGEIRQYGSSDNLQQSGNREKNSDVDADSIPAAADQHEISFNQWTRAVISIPNECQRCSDNAIEISSKPQCKGNPEPSSQSTSQSTTSEKNMSYVISKSAKRRIRRLRLKAARSKRVTDEESAMLGIGEDGVRADLLELVRQRKRALTKRN
eukprot:SAG31_NODE_12_length_38498_cov_21.161671_34_plen_198_part_00